MSDSKIEASAISTYELFSAREIQYFVIPPYQRQYSWTDSDIQRLLEDIYQCINDGIAAQNDGTSIIFLGSIIAVKFTDDDKDPKTNDLKINSYFNSQQPASMKYASIIDGQQRLSTCALIAAVLYQRSVFLSEQLKVISAEKNLSPSTTNGLEQKLKSLRENLLSLIGVEFKDKDNISRYNSKIARLPADFFSSQNANFYRYHSAIPYFLKEFTLYIENLSGKSGNDKKKKTASSKRGLFDGHEHVYKLVPMTKTAISAKVGDSIADEIVTQFDSVVKLRLKFIENALDYICMPFDLQTCTATGRKLFENDLRPYSTDQIAKILEQGIRGLHFQDCEIKPGESPRSSEEIKRIAAEEILSSEELQCIMRYTIFAHTFLHQVYFTLVTSSEEDYAFSMFDSLNTTGQPLTAYETFKAQIINSIKDNYNNSREKKIIDFIDNFFITEKNKSITESVITAFAKYSTGQKLTKRLNVQRNFMKNMGNFTNNKAHDAIDPALFPDYLTTLLQKFSHVTSFYQAFWSLPAIRKLADKRAHMELKYPECHQKLEFNIPYDVMFALHMLVSTSHDAALPVLLRFYSAMLEGADDSTTKIAEDKLLDFYEAVRLVFAFTLLYRLGSVSTDGIDGIYLSTCKTDFNVIEPAGSLTWLPRADSKGSRYTALDNKTLLKKLRTYLKEQLLLHFTPKKESAEVDLAKEQWLTLLETNELYSSDCRQFIKYALLLSYLKDCSKGQSTDGRICSISEDVVSQLYLNFPSKFHLNSLTTGHQAWG